MNRRRFGINAFALFSRAEEEIEGWDVFKYFPLRLKTGSRADTRLVDNLVKLAKALTYVVLFLLVLCGGVLAKLTIIFSASQISDDGAVAYCDYNDFGNDFMIILFAKKIEFLAFEYELVKV